VAYGISVGGDALTNLARVLVEMLSKAWPEWTFNNSNTHYHPSELCF